MITIDGPDLLDLLAHFKLPNVSLVRIDTERWIVVAQVAPQRVCVSIMKVLELGILLLLQSMR